MTATALVATNFTMNQAAALDRMLEDDPRLRSENTKRAYRRDVLDFLTWWQGSGREVITKSAIETYCAHLQAQQKAPASINRGLASIRWYVRKIIDAVDEDSNIDPHTRTEMIRLGTKAAAVGDLKNNRALKGRHVPRREVTKLLDACERDPSPAGVRDAAMISLGWQAGLRRSEIAGLTVGDVVPEEEGYTLRIMGKGQKVREVFVYNGAAEALADWLVIRGEGAIDKPVFCRILRGGHLQVDAPLTGTTMQMILTGRKAKGGRCEQAKVPPLTWHDLRRTLAGDLLGDGVDVSTVQQVLGHSSPATTTRYDRRDRTVRQAALRRRETPYTRRTLKVAA